MTYTPLTPFRRPMDAGLMAQHQSPQPDLPPQGANKWEVLRELSVARTRLGVTDRELIVLQALLSFHPDTILGGNSDDLVIYPSNASICARLNGMPCSTMRRHLAGLVRAGLIQRRDSPNGKRYARRYGDSKEAFGFDLSPLPRRFAEICALAEGIRAEEDRYKRLRQSVSLMRRDLASLAAYGAETRPQRIWSQFKELALSVAALLRRKLGFEDLEDLEMDLLEALNHARDVLECFTENMSTNDAQVEQHHQNSNTDSHDLEPCLEKAGARGVSRSPDTEIMHSADPRQDADHMGSSSDMPNIPLALVRSTCPEIQSYAQSQIRHWHELVRAADIVRPMMGISSSAWDMARAAMGPEAAAVVVAAMLERMDAIKSPGGYLRTLSRKAEAGAFSCAPMVMALMRREAA